MFTLPLSARPRHGAALAALVAAGCLGQFMPGDAAAAALHTTPAAVTAAGVHSSHADHALVSSAHALKHCQRVHPRHCSTERRALQRAGKRLSRAERKLAQLGRADAAGLTAHAAATIAAPKITVSGQSLTWTKVTNATSYVLVKKVAGIADQYSVIRAASTTPVSMPGKTARFSVRANLSGGTWAPEVSIAYAPVPPPVDTKAAPTVTVSNQTLSWKAIGSISSYILDAKVTGQADTYSVVNGTTVTPTVVPGATVSYSVRTDVDGSAWSVPSTVSYPAPPPPPAATPAPTSFTMGVVAGSAISWELPFIQQLGAHTARMEFSIGTSASSMASTIDAYAKAGIRPLLLAGFGSSLPTAAQSQNLASWAAAYGPGGTFWQGKSYPADTAVTDIEFGNETSYTYQFSDNSSSTYAARAQTYALRAKDAAVAIDAANPKVGLLAQGDNAQQGTSWVTNMLKAVPNLGQLVDGWTIHPYGPNWASRMDSTINSAKAAGAPDKPLWVTEYGLSTDNGRCLSDNYGWDKCMTYSAAATTLHTVLTGMESRYGDRLGAFYLYAAHDLYASGTQSGRESYFGALQLNKASKGAFTTEVKTDLASS